MGSRSDSDTIARLGGLMYLLGAAVGAATHLLAARTALWPVPLATALGVLMLTVGPRLTPAQLYVFGLFGAVSAGCWFTVSHGYADSALLFVWPALFVAYFYGHRGTGAIIVWIAIVHAVDLAITPHLDGRPTRWVVLVASVSLVGVVVRGLVARNERLVAELRAEARIDPLTGVLNRRGLDERLEIELSRAQRDNGWLGIVLFDLDHFKAVNDQHGHELGDRVLSWLGAVLQRHARQVDIVARAGGEEFVVVLPGQDPASARAFAERVRATIAASDRRDAGGGIAKLIGCTVSGGVACAIAPRDAQCLLEAADQAMYAAKRAGRNAIIVAQLAPDGSPQATGAGAAAPANATPAAA